jgi:hypothetical protein
MRLGVPLEPFQKIRRRRSYGIPLKRSGEEEEEEGLLRMYTQKKQEQQSSSSSTDAAI